jgi:hypothetical protein
VALINGRFGALLLLLFASLAAPAVAQTAPKTAVFLRGTCEHLSIPAGDLTSTCKPSLVNMQYRDGRSSFMFSDGERSMISFSGARAAPDARAIQQLDHVSIATKGASGGTDVSSEDATGTCDFGNVFAGASARITCTAKTKSGTLNAIFRTDGAKPDVVDF